MPPRKFELQFTVPVVLKHKFSRTFSMVEPLKLSYAGCAQRWRSSIKFLVFLRISYDT